MPMFSHMGHRATRHPDGSIEIEGSRYTLDEQGDRFVVVDAGGAQVGSFRVKDVSHRFEVDAAPDRHALVRAIARLMASPRGILPLQ